MTGFLRLKLESELGFCIGLEQEDFVGSLVGLYDGICVGLYVCGAFFDGFVLVFVLDFMLDPT